MLITFSEQLMQTCHYYFHSYLHVSIWSKEYASNHSSKITQVENVVGLRWSWEEAAHGILINCKGGLYHDFA